MMEKSERFERTSGDLREPLSELPDVEFAFAYGSGVFAQPAVSASKQRNDTENLERNPSHYASLLRRFGGSAVVAVADHVGVGVHFNTLVPWRNQMIKYGVASTEHILADVLSWDSLYVGGRLQKPVAYLEDLPGLRAANGVNLQAALAAALLLLPPRFTEEELYAEICGLSYRGDIRMFFAEDRQKVLKIVRGSFAELRHMYAAPALQLAGCDLLFLPGTSSCPTTTATHAPYARNDSPEGELSLVAALPSSVLLRMAATCRLRLPVAPGNLIAEGGAADLARAMRQQKRDVKHLVRASIASIVRRSSLRQAVSSFLAAGGVNSVQYVTRKMKKAWQSLR
eukprot:jgi/Mesen1/4704/ME000241S03739